MTTTRMTEPEPGAIHCTACGLEWTVSTVDPDSTLDDARTHITRRHPADAPTWHTLIKNGRP